MLGFGWQELLIVLVIVMIIFGAGKLTQVGSALGRGVKEFKTEAVGGEPDPAITGDTDGKDQDRALGSREVRADMIQIVEPVSTAGQPSGPRCRDDGVEQVIDQYIVAWNETDPTTRRELIARTWTEDGSYLDPLMSGAGHDGIDAMIGGVQTQFPGYRFRRVGEPDAHNNVVRFSWALGPADGPALAGGVDFGVIVDSRLQSITGFLDFAPGASGQ